MTQEANNDVLIERSAKAFVRDARGKRYTLELKDGGVVITPPTSFRVAPIAFADLRRALTELEAAAGA